jgi:pimeloyl-ACP methyl ester carboxylesterase
LAQLYAARYPTRGLVLIDGLTADVADLVTSRLASYGSLAVPARLGLLRPAASSFVGPGFPGSLRERLLALRSRSSSISSVAREGRMAGEELGTSRLRASESARTVPMLIIAAQDTDVPEGELFTRSSEALAVRNPDSTYVLVAGAGHDLIATHPGEVADTIRAWLLAVQP